MQWKTSVNKHKNMQQTDKQMHLLKFIFRKVKLGLGLFNLSKLVLVSPCKPESDIWENWLELILIVGERKTSSNEDSYWVALDIGARTAVRRRANKNLVH